MNRGVFRFVLLNAVALTAAWAVKFEVNAQCPGSPPSPNDFCATAYYVIYEEDLGGTQKVTRTIPVEGGGSRPFTLKASFWFGGQGVAMQGTGRTGPGGNYIKWTSGGGGWACERNNKWFKWDPASGQCLTNQELTKTVIKNYKDLGVTDFTGFGRLALVNPNSANYQVVNAVRGSSGRVLKAWYSIAVDPKLIRIGTPATTGKLYFRKGNRPNMLFQADDTGGAIKGKRIDIYVGEGRAAMDEWNRSGGNRWVAISFYLASDLNRPWNLVIDGTSVYWVENNLNGSVKKVSKNRELEGGSVSTLATGLVEPTAIAVDNTYVYWIERNNGSNGSIKRIKKDGTSLQTLATGLNNAQNFMALDTNNIYFADGKPGGGAIIRKVSKNGGLPVPLAGTDMFNLRPAIAVDGSYVYFTDDLGNIKRASVNGGSVTTLGPGNPIAMALDSSNIYWVEYSGGTVKKLPKSGGAPTTLASGLNSPSGIAVDGTSVYVIEYTWPGAVKKVSVNGGSVTTLATETNAIGIVVDSENAYWTVNLFINQGKIAKVSKQGTASVLSATSFLETEEFEIGQPNPVLKNTATGFRVEASGAKDLSIQIFNLSGKLVFHTDWVENGFEWNLLNDRGQRLANGVYLYVVYVKGWDGTVMRSEVKKLVILR